MATYRLEMFDSFDDKWCPLAGSATEPAPGHRWINQWTMLAADGSEDHEAWLVTSRQEADAASARFNRNGWKVRVVTAP